MAPFESCRYPQFTYAHDIGGMMVMECRDAPNSFGPLLIYRRHMQHCCAAVLRLSCKLSRDLAMHLSLTSAGFYLGTWGWR
jgi:hypothetical protein